jgi:hypothetical protein
MRKVKLSIAAMSIAIGALLMNSCIGSFGLTMKVLNWNQQVTNEKWVNELVFLVFWVVPVYEISLFIDGVILNTIEFWTGSSPVSQVDTTVKGVKGTYHVKSNDTGYDVVLLETGEKAQFVYDNAAKTWSIAANNKIVPLIKYNNDGIANILFNGQVAPSYALAK